MSKRGKRDVNERVRAEWKEETTTAERVRSILLETHDAQSAGEIAGRALVSEPAARKYLNELCKQGVATAVQDGRTTRYKRDEEYLILKRVRELRRDHSRAELIEGVREMKEVVRRFESEYDARSPEELTRQLEADDESGWSDLSRWQTTRKNLALAQTALAYGEAYDLATA